MMDVLSIGSLTVDTFYWGADLHHTVEQVNPEERAFVLPVGGKIGIERVYEFCGGGAANTSIGFAKLGLRAGVLSSIGEDHHGHFITRTLDHYGIDQTCLQRVPGGSSSQSVVLMAEDGGRTVLHHKMESPPEASLFPPETAMRCVYLGHVREESEGLIPRVVAWKQQYEGILGWNPGSTQLRKGWEHWQEILRHTDVLILNVEELEQLTRMKAPVVGASVLLEEIELLTVPDGRPATVLRDVRAMAALLLGQGLGALLVTDGGAGAQLYTAAGAACYAPGTSQPPVSTLGAGDSCSVGYIAALLHGEPPAMAMRWAAINAAGTVQIFGAQEGQRTLEEMRALTGASL
ncbi:carbohydrate kinase family protein [Candidatus Peribacteria bacterium]|nr:carbohydrate kinase family protein [Candidatus Peribacteria bacterium]